MKRKRSAVFARGVGDRPAVALPRSTFRLPTVAALAAAFAFTTMSASARAVIAGDTGVEDADSDAAPDGDLDADAPEAASCPPALGGVPQVTRVHGTGCGCGSDGSEGGTAALAASAAVAAILLKRRR